MQLYTQTHDHMVVIPHQVLSKKSTPACVYLLLLPSFEVLDPRYASEPDHILGKVECC